MSAPNITRWIGIGLLGLPLYGVLTFFSSLDPQPDPGTHYEAWSRFVTTDAYVLKHLFLSILGVIFAIFGTFALAAYLTRSRAGRMGLWAMVITVFGSTLFLTWGGVSTFSAPEEGQAVLAGMEEIGELPSILANTMALVTMVASILLLFVGNVLLGVAVWRSGILPKWAGALWAAAPVLMYVFGHGVRDDDRRPGHPSDGSRRRGAAGHRRGVDGMERVAPTLSRDDRHSGPTEGAITNTSGTAARLHFNR